jgi:hypothetical protein
MRLVAMTWRRYRSVATSWRLIEGTTKQMLIRDHHPAAKRDAIGLGPALEHHQVVVIDDELGVATGADNGHRAVVTALAPFDQITIGMTIGFTEVLDDRLQRRRHIGDQLAVDGYCCLGHNDTPWMAVTQTPWHGGGRSTAYKVRRQDGKTVRNEGTMVSQQQPSARNPQIPQPRNSQLVEVGLCDRFRLAQPGQLRSFENGPAGKRGIMTARVGDAIKGIVDCPSGNQLSHCVLMCK